VAAVVIVLSGVVAGCGSSSGPQVASLGTAGATNSNAAAPSPSASVDREASARAFSSCMRKNGVTEFPDPTVDSNGNVQMGLGPLSGIDRNDPTVRKAFTACRPMLQALRPQFTPEQRQQFQDALLKYAQCMRANGYQMADPNFSGDGGGFRAFSQINLKDPAFQKADAVCRPQTLGNLPFGPGGGGFGGGNRPSNAPTASGAAG
jgi:hypothetical protein